MLRTSGARGIKTTNFDACRDLNGRRLRHVNAEAQLREWEASAEERKQKKAEQRAREAASRPGPAEALPERCGQEGVLHGAARILRVRKEGTRA